LAALKFSLSLHVAPVWMLIANTLGSGAILATRIAWMLRMRRTNSLRKRNII